jgi:hypothetical protein
MVIIKEQWGFYSSEPILGIEIGDVNNNGSYEIASGHFLHLKRNLVYSPYLYKDTLFSILIPLFLADFCYLVVILEVRVIFIRFGSGNFLYRWLCSR